jgi:hypothetical protein
MAISTSNDARKVIWSMLRGEKGDVNYIFIFTKRFLLLIVIGRLKKLTSYKLSAMISSIAWSIWSAFMICIFTPPFENTYPGPF